MADPRYTVNPLGGFNVGQALGDAFAQRERRGMLENQELQKQQMQNLMGAASQGDQAAIAELYKFDPQTAQAFEQRLAGQETAQQDARTEATVDFIEKLSFMEPEKQEAAFNLAVDDDRFDIDEEDRALFNRPEYQRAVIGKFKGEDYVNNLFGKQEEVKPTKFQQGTGKLSGYVFNPETGEYSVSDSIKGKLEEVKASGVVDAKTRQSINKDLTQLTQDTKLIRNTAKDLDKLSKIKSGPASIAMVFKFMKALDPTSVVREGEFATAENSSGVPEAVRNVYNKVMSGGRLGDKQAKEFVNTAKQLANSAIESSGAEVGSFLETFEDTLPKSFKEKLSARIPKPFEVESVKGNNKNIVLTHPVYGEVTEADIQKTMSDSNMTREQVLTQLGNK